MQSPSTVHPNPLSPTSSSTAAPPPRAGRRGPPPGPGFYQRTLSSSSLFSGKCGQVAKSRSEYCGINQVCNSYDLFGQNNNANLNPSLRNHLSRSGNIVYRSGGVAPGISFVDTNSFLENRQPPNASASDDIPPPPPPPDRRLLVRGLSRTAFVNIPEYQEQQSYYWLQQKQQKQNQDLQKQRQLQTQQQQQQQQQPPYFWNNSSTFEQQYLLQQQFLSKVQNNRRVAGSHPDISRSTLQNNQNLNMTPLSPFPVSNATGPGGVEGGGDGSGGGGGGDASASPHQVAINMPSNTSPITTRRLLPRIITKKTENATVLVVGSNRILPPPPPTEPSETPGESQPPPQPANYISPEESELTASNSSTPQKTDASSTVRLKDSLGNIPRPLPSSTAAPSKGILSSKNSTPSKLTGLKCRSPKVSIKLRGAPATKRSHKIPAPLTPYYKNAPIKKLKHPLEENIFSSLFITLFAVGVALMVGVPILCGLGLLAFGAVGFRYLLATLHGMASYTRFICSNRQHPICRSGPPPILPRDRLAFANDVRWLGSKGRSRCQSILHSLLVFEGTMDLNTLRHLIQTRVLRAETPEGELAYPRLLQKLVGVTAGYLWELDLTFDIQNHVIPGPTHFTTEAQLQHYIGRLLTQSMPLNRPLWDIRLLPSYYGSGKDTMIILRVHQCLADGMSLIRILSHNLSDHQQMHVPQRPHFAGMSFGFNVLRSLIVGPITIFLWWFTTFRDKNIFSAPLPKSKKRSRRKFWRSCFRRRRGASEGGDEGDGEAGEGDEEENISFTSSIGSSSTSSVSSISSDSRSRSSRSSLSSANANANTNVNTISGLNNGKKGRAKGKFVHAFRSPKSDAQAGSPVSSLNRQNLPQEETQAGGEDGQDQSGGDQSKASSKSVTGKISRGGVAKNLNKCLGKNISGSKSSLRSQNRAKTKSGSRKKKRKRRKRRGGRKSTSILRGRRHHHHHHHHHHRRRLASLASSHSFSSASSGSSRSSRMSYDLNWESDTRRPPSWNVMWSAPLSLPKVARIKQIMRSSYNDVLLSAAAGSVRTYMQQQGIPYPGDVQVVIPVDLRNDIASPKQSTRLGCKVSSVLATIPSGIESAIPRLWATRHRLDELKASADSVVAYGATTILMNILPHRLAIPILDSILNKASLQFCNLPGPTCTTVIGGYPVKGIYPIYPPTGRIRAAISVFTYADQVHFTVVTHRSLVNAGPSLMRGITDQVEQLSRQLSQRRVPGESRRSARNFHQANNVEITKPPTRQIQLQLQVVQEELAQLNSRLEAQGILITDDPDFTLGTCHISGIPAGIPLAPSTTSQGSMFAAAVYPGAAYHNQAVHLPPPPPPHHHHHHHHHHHPQQHYLVHNIQPPMPPQQQQPQPPLHHPAEQPSSSASDESGGPGVSGDLIPAAQAELQQRLKTLKNEFAQLIGELRRRSSIVEGIAMSFEHEEHEEEYRKPRKRALSVVSMTRRSSIFSARSNTAPDSPVYSSEDDLPSSPSTAEMRQQPQHQPSGTTVSGASGSGAGGASSSSSGGGGSSSGTSPQYATCSSNIRHTSSPMRTTAV